MIEKQSELEEYGWDDLKEALQIDLDQYRRELKEIALMLEQSQLEVKKLTQRNASITAHLQQVQSQFDSLPRADIRMTYDSALDAQQRLFVMRGQVDKLQNDQNHLSKQVDLIERTLQVMEAGPGGKGGKQGPSETAEAVEMIIQAQESERQRLSRQMHDGPAQALSNFILQTEIALRLFDMDQDKAKEELSNLKMSATSTFQKVRDFIFELRPMMLDDLGLAPTVKRYIEAFKEQAGVDVRLTVTGQERRLESYQEVMIFRAIQELLNNVARHSRASQVQVQMDMGESNIKVVVDDNGKGFDYENLPERGMMGLKVIRERVEMLGGYFEVDSVIGQGARISLQIPATTTSVSV
ncbi:MAG: sensor histidine kinase [Anaerolineales bacterium]|jgi:two-component system sensor histidine kinase DegS